MADGLFQQSQLENGFLGISINHRYFSRRIMECFFPWCEGKFNEFVILLMDDPDQYNYQVFLELSAEDALAKARKLSDDRKRGYEKSLRKLGLNSIRIVQFRDFQHDIEFQRILASIKSECATNLEFQHSLKSLMMIGIGGKIREHSLRLRWSDDLKNDHEMTLLNYIIEELAAIVYFSENGYPIEVDPTREFSTKTELYEGKFPELSRALGIKKRGHLFAYPEGNPKQSY